MTKYVYLFRPLAVYVPTKGWSIVVQQLAKELRNFHWIDEEVPSFTNNSGLCLYPSRRRFGYAKRFNFYIEQKYQTIELPEQLSTLVEYLESLPHEEAIEVGGHLVEVSNDGSEATVGCLTVDFETAEKIYNRMKSRHG